MNAITRPLTMFFAMAGWLCTLQANVYADTQSASSPPKQWSTPVDGVSIGVAIGPERFTPGQSMTVRIYFKNVSGRTLTLRRPLSIYDYLLTVLQNDQTIAQRPQPESFSDSDVPQASLNNGDVDTESIDLAKLYDLHPGKYTLNLTFPAHIDGKDPVLEVAPPVVFTVG